MEDKKAKFVRYGLAEKVAEDAAANEPLCRELNEALARCPTEHLEHYGVAAYTVLTAWPREGSAASKSVVLDCISKGWLDNSVRVKEVSTRLKERRGIFS
jgi:ferritin-like metal-binding protein YciE